MINEPLFPSIRSVYDYLAYRDDPSNVFEYESRSCVEKFDYDEGGFGKYYLKMSLFKTVQEGAGPSSGIIQNAWTAPFVLTDFRESGSTGIYLEGETLSFETSVERDEAIEFLEARNRLAEEAAADGLKEAFKIADRLYDCGYSQAMVNFTEMLPDAAYTNFDAARALLFYISVGDRILGRHANLTDEAIDDCREFIIGGDNKNVYDQIKGLFVNLAEVVSSEDGVNPELSRTVAYLLYRRHLVNQYSAVWTDTYGSVPTEGIGDYLAECVACDRVSTSDIVALSALSYCLIGSYEPFADADYIHVIVELYGIVQDEENRKSKSSFRDQLFANASSSTSKSRVTIDDVDLMTGEEFEKTVAALFSEMGYSVEITKRSGDQGIDVIAQKEGVRIGIQAKCYGQSVGNGAVQEVVAGKAYYNCKKAMVVTNRSFTSSAQELAASNGVVLWDRDVLRQKLGDYSIYI